MGRMMAVMMAEKAEFAQSYMIQPRSARVNRFSISDQVLSAVMKLIYH